MTPSAAAPSPQEVHRKLSMHTTVKPAKLSHPPVSGTDSDSDSMAAPDVLSPSAASISSVAGSFHPSATGPQHQLSSIAERRSNSGDESDEDEDDDEEGGWKAGNDRPRPSLEDGTIIRSGYLYKKGQRRKTWKKRWFVLRPAHLAYYKNSAEYKLLRLLELSDVHSCTKVLLKRQEHAFGLVCPTRTFYLHAKTSVEVDEWVAAIEQTRQALMAQSTQTSVSSPIPIPDLSSSRAPLSITPSPPSHLQNFVTSSDSEDATPLRTYSSSSQQHPINLSASPSRPSAMPKDGREPTRQILMGYLMKCGSGGKRKSWRKRWFVLTVDKLVYSASHMDTRPHRLFPFTEVLDALEYDVPSQRHVAVSPPAITPALATAESEFKHTFKIVTTRRTLLLCAPTEEDEIKWLGAIRALIARRTGTGVVPGIAVKQPHAGGPGMDVTASASGGSSSGGVGSGGSGVRAKIRRLSVTGLSSGLPTPAPADDHHY
ncbi:PH-domain-containing protein [Fistulina hepatica ATCC 64428]|nr:PH-domain-containing protein [Fistulina hepatica ATCC 64428]